LSICWVLSQSLGIAHAEAISFGGRRPVGPPQPRQSRHGATARRRDGFPGVFLPRVQPDGRAVVDPRAVISYSPKPSAKNDSRKHPYELRRDVPQSRL